MKIRDLSTQEQEIIEQSMKTKRSVVCGYRVGAPFNIEGETWLFYDADAAGSGYEGVFISPDYSKVLESVPAHLF